MNKIDLTNIQIDALKETANIGAGNASATLSQIVKKKVNVVVSELEFVSLTKVERIVAGPKKMVLNVYTPVSGDMSGNIVVVLPMESALELASVVEKVQVTQKRTLSKTDQEILRKIGDILSDSYLASLAQFFEMNIERESSRVIPTFGESVVDFIMLSINKEEKDIGLYLKTNFTIKDTDIKGEFLLLLTTKETIKIVKALQEKI